MAKVYVLNQAIAYLQQIETDSSSQLYGALSPKQRAEPERTSFGIAALDELSSGGLPAGALTELVGPVTCGRTTIALSLLAGVTRSEHVCAWIDAADSLDPESAAASGVNLERLLWVRCGPGTPALPASAEQRQDIASVTALASASQPRHTGGGSPHPRSEAQDMPQAISALLLAHGGLYDRQRRKEKRAVGTPGAPNRPLSERSEHREEQVNSDRLPPRRGENLAIPPRCAESLPRLVINQPSSQSCRSPRKLHGRETAASKPWHALDQALKATDLLLQSGGFSVIVLDLGSVPPEFVWRIPLATWFRFRAACERTRVSLLLLTQHACTRSSAELVVRLQNGSMESESNVMTGICYGAVAERSRSYASMARVVPIRKPPQSERPGQWRGEAAWAQAK